MIDCGCAGLLAVCLWRLDRGADRERGSLAFDWRSLSRSVTASVSSYWQQQLWPWNWLQICFLVSLSGMMVYAYAIAEAQQHVSVTIAFASAWFFYGLAFWLTAPLLRNPRLARQSALVFAGLLVVGGGATGVVGASAINVHILVYILLTFVNAYWIHYSNVQLAERAPAAQLGQVRASMVFYLGLVFGVGEQVVGWVLTLDGGMSALGWARMVLGVALLVGVIAATKVRRSAPGGTPVGVLRSG